MPFTLPANTDTITVAYYVHCSGTQSATMNVTNVVASRNP